LASLGGLCPRARITNKSAGHAHKREFPRERSEERIGERERSPEKESVQVQVARAASWYRREKSPRSWPKPAKTGCQK